QGLEKSKMEAQANKTEKQKDKSKPEVNTTQNLTPEVAEKSEIVYDDFAKLDLRIGTIRKAEKVEKADKLLKLEVDLGFEKRIIVSGIAQHFSPESLIEKQLIVL